MLIIKIIPFSKKEGVIKARICVVFRVKRNVWVEPETFLFGLSRKGKYNRESSGGDLSKQLADEFKVSQRTIKNEANFAAGLSNFVPELQQTVLVGDSPLSKTVIQHLAKREDIKEGEVETIEDISSSSPFERNKDDEITQRKKEISTLALSMASKSDYNQLAQKAKELQLPENQQIKYKCKFCTYDLNTDSCKHTSNKKLIKKQ